MNSNRYRSLYLCLITVFFQACTQKTPNGEKSSRSSNSEKAGTPAAKTSNNTGIDTSTGTNPEYSAGFQGEPGTHTANSSITPKESFKSFEDRRSMEEIFCQEGPKASERHEDNFSNIFAYLCSNGSPSESFKRIQSTAYSCTGEPEVIELEFKIDELFTTNLMFAYAVKIPISSPDQVADLNLFAEFEKGVTDGETIMTYKVEDRKQFPGKGSLERIEISYRTLRAGAAALYDTRRTYINNYLLSEPSRDITLALESLVQPNENEFYHAARQMALGLKNSDNSSTIIYVPEMIIVNRIDPPRIKKSLFDLAKEIAKTTCRVALSKN